MKTKRRWISRNNKSVQRVISILLFVAKRGTRSDLPLVGFDERQPKMVTLSRLLDTATVIAKNDKLWEHIRRNEEGIGKDIVGGIRKWLKNLLDECKACPE